MMMVSWFYYGNARFKGWSQTSTQYFSRIPRRYKKKKKRGKEEARAAMPYILATRSESLILKLSVNSYSLYYDS